MDKLEKRTGFWPTPVFEKLALEYLGCDGGDRQKHGIWFCGIEWGGGFTKETSFEKMSIGLPDYTEKDLSEFFGPKYYPYNHTMAKFFAYYSSDSLSNYIEFCKSKQMLMPGSGVLKLNLYPFSFSRDDDALWEKWVFEKTGFYSKSIYRNWCARHRFPVFTKLVDEYCPKLIVCSSLSYLEQFILAFFGNSDVFEIKRFMREEGKIEWNGKRAHYYCDKDRNITLLVTPFFGYYKNSLNSEEDIKILVDEFKKRC